MSTGLLAGLLVGVLVVPVVVLLLAWWWRGSGRHGDKRVF